MLDGGAGNDVLNGRGDTLIEGEGLDTLRGDDGNDSLLGASGNDGDDVIVGLAAEIDEAFSP